MSILYSERTEEIAIGCNAKSTRERRKLALFSGIQSTIALDVIML